MKKTVYYILVAAMSFALMTGCGKDNTDSEQTTTQQGTEEGQTEQNGQTETTGNSGSDTDATKEEVTAEQMKEAYLDFIKGNVKMTAKNPKIAWFEEGKEYSYDEMNAACSEGLKSYYGYEEGDDESEVELSEAMYAFIDCGADGVPEFIISQYLKLTYDYINVYSIFKYIDGKVCCVSSRYGYYRSYVDVNEYGYITYGGSGGAATHYFEKYFVDKDGNEVYLYNEQYEMGLDGPYISDYYFPNHEAPDGYTDDRYYMEGEVDNSCSAYNFTEYTYDEDNSYEATIDEEYYKNYFFTFYDEEGNYLEPDEELAKIYKENGIVYDSIENTEKKVRDHEESLGVTAQIRDGGAISWNSFIDVGVGEYKQTIYGYYSFMSKVPGRWKIPDEYLAEGVSGIFLEIHDNAEFELNINYEDKYTSPVYITGHIAFVYNYNGTYEDNIIFYVNSSNCNEVSERTFLGVYVVDEYRVNSKTITMTFKEGEDYYMSSLSTSGLPVFEKEYSQEGTSKFTKLSNISEDYYYYDYEELESSSISVSTPDFDVIKCTSNQITDDDIWLNEHGMSEWTTDYSDDSYIYKIGGLEGYGTYTQLSVYDKSTKELIKTFDFHDFIYANGYSNSFVARGVRYALVKDDVLYVNVYHRTYASSCPYNAFVLAIDMNTASLIWRTENLVSNSYNFVFIGNDIVTGYGFTDEDHYLAIINRFSGCVDKKVDIKKSPEYFKYEDGVLSVRTYSYDYEFRVLDSVEQSNIDLY